MPWAEFAALFYCLPDESVSYRVLHGWSFDQQVAVLTLEHLDRVAAELHYLRLGKQARKWKPLRIPRPEQNRPRPQRMSIAEFKAYTESGGET